MIRYRYYEKKTYKCMKFIIVMLTLSEKKKLICFTFRLIQKQVVNSHSK